MKEDTFDSKVETLDARVDGVTERLANMEGKYSELEKGSVKKKISEFGGILALFLSIVIGGYTVFDKFVSGPQRDFENQVKEVRKNLISLTDINSKIAGLDWRNSPAESQAQAGVWFPTRVALVEEIEGFYAKYPHILTISDIMTLANENAHFTRFDRFLKHANTALKLAITPIEQANSYWMLARAHGMLRSISEMRINYDDAISAFNQIGFEGNALSILQLQTQWMYFEMSNNGCSGAENVFVSFKENYDSPFVTQITRNEIKRQFDTMLNSINRSCNLVLN